MPTPLHAVNDPADIPPERCSSCFWRDGSACRLNPASVPVDPGHWCSHHATLDGDDVVRTFAP